VPHQTITYNIYYNPLKKGGEYSMLDTAKRFLREVVEIGLLLIAVAVILQVIFGAALPFLGGDVVGNLLGIITTLGEGGLVGLIAVGIILYLINKNS
jgi:hypothetical protein|tara:strand:+ start:1005 stop:1295 length:291 start_codon:yes stop_codon:yes gene_type:complete